MGRAERRRAERRDRIESSKHNITMSRQELGEIKDDISKYNVEALMTCFALAERRLYGFGAKRIFKTLEYIDELMGYVVDGSKSVEDYKRELKEEVGVVIKS